MNVVSNEKRCPTSTFPCLESMSKRIKFKREQITRCGSHSSYGYVNNRDEVSHCQRFHLRLGLDHGSTDSLILQCMSDRPVANISKCSHLLIMFS